MIVGLAIYSLFKKWLTVAMIEDVATENLCATFVDLRRLIW